MPRSYGTGPRSAEEPEEDRPAGPDSAYKIKGESEDAPENADAEGHGAKWIGPEDRAQGDEPPNEPGDPDDWIKSDRNVKRDIVPVRW